MVPDHWTGLPPPHAIRSRVSIDEFVMRPGLRPACMVPNPLLEAGTPPTCRIPLVGLEGRGTIGVGCAIAVESVNTIETNAKPN
jgi:hypothetical protein